MQPMKNCDSLEAVRDQIDTIDEQIAELIGLRNAYVKQAAKFKRSADEVKAEDRVRAVINKARERGIQRGVNPNLMEELYRLMIEKMVETELAEFQNRREF
ncbi:MAG: chorismate mutase [Campylobacterales bacterium]